MWLGQAWSLAAWGEPLSSRLGKLGNSFLRDAGRFERHVAVRMLLLGIIFHANHILHVTSLGFIFLRMLTQSPENSFINLSSSLLPLRVSPLEDSPSLASQGS